MKQWWQVYYSSKERSPLRLRPSSPPWPPGNPGQNSSQGFHTGIAGHLELDSPFLKVLFDHLPGTTQGNYLPVVHDSYPAAKPLSLFHIVSGYKNRLALLFEALYDFPHCAPGLRVQPCGGLVQKHDVGVVYESQGNRQPLLLATGKIPEDHLPALLKGNKLDDLG